MAKKVIAIRHVLYEDLGSFEGVLINRGYEIQYVDAGIDDLKHINENSIDVLFIVEQVHNIFQTFLALFLILFRYWCFNDLLMSLLVDFGRKQVPNL